MLLKEFLEPAEKRGRTVSNCRVVPFADHRSVPESLRHDIVAAAQEGHASSRHTVYCVRTTSGGGLKSRGVDRRTAACMIEPQVGRAHGGGNYAVKTTELDVARLRMISGEENLPFVRQLSRVKATTTRACRLLMETTTENSSPKNTGLQERRECRESLPSCRQALSR
jgi:hypothetical protein